MKKIILIGGAPATGKSTIAKKLSKQFNIPWLSTDFIRTWMKSVVSEEGCPCLFNFQGITAEEHYKKYTIEETMEMEQARDYEVWHGVSSFIQKNKDWDVYIIEGISLHPKYIKGIIDDEFELIPIFIIDKNKERIHNILYSRGLWGEANSYSDSVKEIEKKYLEKTNDYYLSESIKNEFPYFELKESHEETISSIQEYLVAKLK